MMDDDESDEMEQDLELDEFFDKIKFFKAKSATKIRKLKELLCQKDELIFNLRSELTKAQDALSQRATQRDKELEELDIISPSKKKRTKQSRARSNSSSDEELLPKKRIPPRQKGRKLEYSNLEKAGTSSSTSSSGHQMLPSKLLNLKPKEKFLPVPKEMKNFERKSTQKSSRSRQSSIPSSSKSRSAAGSHDISQHFIKKSSKNDKITPEKKISPKTSSFSPLEDVQLIDSSSEDEDITQISMIPNQSLLSQAPRMAGRGMNARLECWLSKAQENTKKRKYASFSPKRVSSSRSKAALESMIDDDDETMCQTSKIYRESKSRSRSVSPKPSSSKTREWEALEKSAEAEQLLFGENSQTQTPNGSDSEMTYRMQCPDTAECMRKWGRKPKGFIGEIPKDTQGKRINEKIDFDLLQRARENRMNDSDLFHQPPSPSLDGSDWEPRWPKNCVLDNFWMPSDAHRLPIDPDNPRLTTT